MAETAPTGDADFDRQLRALREENHRLKVAINRIQQSGVAAPASATLEDTHRQLKQAFDVNRRQLDDIARVHTRFLPHHFPRTCGLEFAANCRPCADVGGDFYDAFRMDDDRVAICMADVSGHGAMAAMAMATARSLLRAALLECPRDQGPAWVFERLARWMASQFENDQFVTMWLGIWDHSTEVLRVASAAHPPAVLWRIDGEPEFLESVPTIPLGLAGVEPVPPEEVALEFAVGDRLFLYTDAWIESRSSDGSLLSGAGFLDFIGNAYGQSTQMAVKLLFMEFERFAANSRITDDVSLFVVDRIE